MKRCPDCGQTSPLEAFPRNRSARDGYGVYCKPCHNERGRISKARNGGSNRYHRRRRYGVDTDVVVAMLERQGHLCAACWEAPATDVDHDHATGRVRGMLCSRCNTTMGKFGDDARVIRRAVGYLEAAARVPLIEPEQSTAGERSA